VLRAIDIIVTIAVISKMPETTVSVVSEDTDDDMDAEETTQSEVVAPLPTTLSQTRFPIQNLNVKIWKLESPIVVSFPR
jgi:hypothetical protein